MNCYTGLPNFEIFILFAFSVVAEHLRDEPKSCLSKSKTVCFDTAQKEIKLACECFGRHVQCVTICSLPNIKSCTGCAVHSIQFQPPCFLAGQTTNQKDHAKSIYKHFRCKVIVIDCFEIRLRNLLICKQATRHKLTPTTNTETMNFFYRHHTM